MSRRIYILLAMFIVLCGTTLPAHAQQSQQEILDTLNNTLQTLSFSTQDPNNFIDEWDNSCQFAVSDNHLIITYHEDNTYLKGMEMQDKYFETGTYSAPLDLLSNASVSPFSQTLGIAIICNDKEKCITWESSGQYEQNGKIFPYIYSKSLDRINIYLPEDLIGPTIVLLQDLLYP